MKLPYRVIRLVNTPTTIVIKTAYIAYYMMSYISTPYQIVLDRAVDTLGHGKDVVDGFNAVKKQYLATCLRMRTTPEKDKIYSKRVRVESMTEEG